MGAHASRAVGGAPARASGAFLLSSLRGAQADWRLVQAWPSPLASRPAQLWGGPSSVFIPLYVLRSGYPEPEGSVPGGLGVEAVDLGRQSPKATSLNKVGLWREVASDPVCSPLALWLFGRRLGVPSDRSCQPNQEPAQLCPSFFSRTLDSHGSCPWRMSFCPRLLWGTADPPRGSHIVHKCFRDATGSFWWPAKISFLDPTSLPSESHNSSSKLYCLN